LVVPVVVAWVMVGLLQHPVKMEVPVVLVNNQHYLELVAHIQTIMLLVVVVEEYSQELVVQ
jgi:hypothetical protein